MNTLPTFINRVVLECCSITQQDEKIATTFFGQLNLKSRFVKSRVGLVTPRIICMIINEAYYTVQEGTASKEDIDLGMKLGTAYPKGPFEWTQEIGLDHVYETLDALYQDTKDERYKIASLLKTEYLKEFIA
jgi:3-hydroxybutyryl-CoA dehydrogenase